MSRLTHSVCLGTLALVLSWVSWEIACAGDDAKLALADKKPAVVVQPAAQPEQEKKPAAEEKPEKKPAAPKPADKAGVMNSVERIHKAMERATEVQFIETPLTDALTFLKKQHHIDIWIDQAKITDQGVATNTPITLSVGGVSLRSVLHLLLDPLQLEWVIEDEVLKITTRVAAGEKLTTQVYHLKPAGESDYDVAQLMDVIVSTVSPETWDEVGGEGSIRPIRNLLSIRQTQRVHAKVEALMTELEVLAGHEAAGKPQKESVSLRVYRTGDYPAEKLASVITVMIAPEAWQSEQHPEGGKIVGMKDVLIVTQTPSIHLRIKRLVSEVVPVHRGGGFSGNGGPAQGIFRLGIDTPDMKSAPAIKAGTEESRPVSRPNPQQSNPVAIAAIDAEKAPAEKKPEGASKPESVLDKDKKHAAAEKAPVKLPEGAKVVGKAENDEDSTEKIREALATIVEVNFIKTPLKDAIAFLASEHHINVWIDEAKITDEGVATDAPVSLKASRVSMQSVLNVLLIPHQLEWVIDDEVLRITTKVAADELLETRIYHIKPVEETGSQMANLIDAITSSVSQNTWDEVGGPGSIRSMDNLLVIRQRQRVHGDVEALLIELDVVADDDAAEPAEPTNVLRVYQTGTYSPEKLVASIEELIAPKTWKEAGGTGVIRVVGSALLVLQTPDVHARIKSLMSSLTPQVPLPQQGQPAAADKSQAQEPPKTPPSEPAAEKKPTVVPKLPVPNVQKNLPEKSAGRFRKPAPNMRPAGLRALKASDPAATSEDTIYEALYSKVDFDVLETPLESVLAAIAKQHNLVVWIDKTKIQEEGVALDTPITLKLNGITLHSGLNILLKPLQLDWVIQDEVLKITTVVSTEELLEAHAYHLKVPEFGGYNFAPIVDIIVSAISPESWPEVGGPGAVRVVGNALVIPQTQRIHAEIEALLLAMDLLTDVEAEAAKAKNLIVLKVYKTGKVSAEQVASNLVEFIEPESWEEAGGIGSIHVVGNALLVSQTADVHLRCRGLIREFTTSPSRSERHAGAGSFSH